MRQQEGAEAQFGASPLTPLLIKPPVFVGLSSGVSVPMDCLLHQKAGQRKSRVGIAVEP